MQRIGRLRPLPADFVVSWLERLVQDEYEIGNMP